MYVWFLVLVCNVVEFVLILDINYFELFNYDKEGMLLCIFGEFLRVFEIVVFLWELYWVCCYLEDLVGDYYWFYDLC